MQTKKTALSMFRKARSKLIQTTSSIRSVITIYLSVHVRWPGKSSGAFAFALIFLFFFHQGKKKKKSPFSFLRIIQLQFS